MKRINLIDWVNLGRYETAPLEKMRYKISDEVGWLRMGGTVGGRVELIQKLAKELEMANFQLGQLSGNPADPSPLDQQIKSITNCRPKRTYWRKK